MASAGARMRLTVEVLPLVPENAHGPHRDQALAAFKGRKFALPVLSEDTFEKVWTQIEHRYKTNYLSAQQAAAFTIKKLQDAYDCDLDLGDTVSAIFEGETDPTMRTIKVVPTFVNRDFSVPVTSNLRPVHVQKRLREITAEHSNKRQRVEQLAEFQEELDPLRDQPVPTTESELSGEEFREDARVNGVRVRSRSRRSQTGGSLVFVQGAQTGRAEFAPGIKEESPELGEPPVAKMLNARRVETTSKRTPSHRRSSVSHSQTPRTVTQQDSAPRPELEVPQADDGVLNDEPAQDGFTPNGTAAGVSQEIDDQDAAIQQSPQSTPADSLHTPPPATTRRKDIYDVSSSPEFLNTSKKPKTTYGRSPRTVSKVQQEVDLLNSSRQSASVRSSSVKKSSRTPLLKAAYAFRLPETDDIESTPQEEITTTSLSGTNAGADLTTAFLDTSEKALQAGVQTPARSTTKAKPGSLKKPSKKAQPATPSNRRSSLRSDDAAPNSVSFESTSLASGLKRSDNTPTSSGSTGKKLDPEIQARLDKINKLHQQKKVNSKVIAHQDPSRSQSAAESPKTNGEARLSIELETPDKRTSINTEVPEIARSLPSEKSINSAVQPRAAPKKSPIPLPTTINPNHNTVVGNARIQSPNDTDVFKKPAPKAQRSVNGTRLGRDDIGRSSSETSDRRSTSRKTEVPLPDNVKHLTSSGKRSARRTSSSSNGARTPATSEAPLSSNQTQANSEDLQPRPPLNGGTASIESKSQTPAASQPKKRGRPRKNPLPSTTPVAVPSSGSAPSETKKRSPQSQSVQAQSPAAVVGLSDEHLPELSPPTENSLEAVPSSKKAIDDAIVISSGVTSVASDSGSESEPLTQDVDNALDKQHGPLQGNDTNSVESSAYVTPTMRDEDVAKDQDDKTSNRIEPNAQILEDNIQASLDAENEQVESDRRAASTVSPWNAGSWGFSGPSQPNSTAGEVNGDAKAESMSVPPIQEESTEAPASTFETALLPEDDSKSRSASAAASNRSSPAVTRRPARFLSHSPTPQSSASDSESDDTSAAPTKAASTQPLANIEDSDSDSTSDDDDDLEMPDAPVDDANSKTTTAPASSMMPSSPPVVRPPTATPIIPSTSQPRSSQTIRQTPVPLPTKARYSGFRTLREQLADAKTKPVTAQKKPYDPRMLDLSKLAAKGNSKPTLGVALDDDDSSDEESSSSSSSSDSD